MIEEHLTGVHVRLRMESTPGEAGGTPRSSVTTLATAYGLRIESSQ